MSEEYINKQTEAIYRLTKSTQKRIEQLENERQSIAALRAVTDDQYEADLKSIQLSKQLLELRRQLAIQTGATKEEIAALTAEINDFNEASQDEIEQLQMKITLQDKGAKGAKNFGTALAGITPIIGGNADITQSYAASLIMTIEKEGGVRQALGASKDQWMASITGVQGALNAYRFFSQATMALIGAAFALGRELDSLNAEFNKATGQSRAFNLQMQSAAMR